MPKEIFDVKEFTKIASGASEIRVVWKDDFAKVKARTNKMLYTGRMPFDAVEKFLSNFKGTVREFNQRPKIEEKPKRSQKRKAKQAEGDQEASSSVQEAVK
ncbi:MAG: 60S ribosomal protein L38 [Nitrososphaeria archaeon]|nr:60S ribosomal protein L38 [Nitrososphaeria archaeon]